MLNKAHLVNETLVHLLPDPDDRVAALAVSLISRRPQGLRAVFSLLSLADLLAAHLELSTTELGEYARDVADAIEHGELEKV